MFKFMPPVKISEIKFISGNFEHLEDIFRNTTVEVLLEGGTDLGNFEKLGDNFLVLGKFDDTGFFATNVTFEQPVKQLRLTFQGSSSNWVLLSEIDIKTS